MQLQIFKYEEDEEHFDNLTTVEIEGEAWFVASEVCKLLDIKNSRDAVSRLDDDEKLVSVLPTSGQNRNVTIISESGLYALIFKSNKPSAKKFRKWVTKEVIPAVRKTGSYGINRLETPNFVIRFNDNWDRTEKGYFSVISELFVRLYGRFEHVGYQIPNKAFNGKEIRPDVSVGKLFATHLRDKYPELSNDYKLYNHRFPNGTEVEARQYKNDLLPIFIKFIDDKWIMENADKYFKERDPVALDYLPKLLGHRPSPDDDAKSIYC
ncbi:MAG TPA: Bro-N domain-containing protein [Paludibacter sp.]|nr:Bro-N domain-containing protein [Paludibacter sp.]